MLFQVEFITDTLKPNFLELGKNGSNFSVIDKTDSSCTANEANGSVVFNSRESHSVSLLFLFIL